MTIPFDFFTLAAVVAELRPTLVGARVQKVQQPTANEVVISVYGRAGARKLLIAADPQAARMHLTQQRRENPTPPLGFCQVARKYLEGAWIEAVELPYPDRLVQLVCRSVDGERVSLACELMGRNANVVLLSGAGVVRGVLRKGGERDLHHGSAYVLPPGVNTDAPVLSRFALAEAGVRPEGELLALTAQGQFAPHSIVENGETVGVWAFAPKTVLGYPRESISVALDTLYVARAEERAESAAKVALLKSLHQELAYRKKALEDTERTLAEATRADSHEQAGNLLLANRALLVKGQESVTVLDFYADSAERVISLDPKKSPQENAEAYFDRARKARDAADYAEGRKADLEDEQEQLQDLLDQAESAEDDALELLQLQLTRLLGGEKPTRSVPMGRKFDGHKVRTVTLDDWTLLIGENATANDHLLTRVAAPSDIWMHIRGATGAHGVLRTNGHPERVPESVLYQAAALVAARSGEKHARVVPVDVTQRRYVRKPRGAKPGQATYSQARTLDVEPHS